MKVVYIGYPKTGTKTIAAALRVLGYNVYDYEENFMFLRKEWREILTEGGTKDIFRKMYSNVDATVDTPVYMFWEELLEAFPDVKFIVNYRDEESWLKSWSLQLDKINHNPYATFLMSITPTGQRFAKYGRFLSRVCFGGHENTWPWNSYVGINIHNTLKTYKQHNLYVKMKVDKSRLLEFNQSEGWKPLCEFLNKPIPQKPFPHLNKSGAVLENAVREGMVFKQAKKEALVILFAIAALVFYFASKRFF